MEANSIVALKSNDDTTTTQTEAYYEDLASQEQVYLDEVEAHLIEDLTSNELRSS